MEDFIQQCKHLKNENNPPTAFSVTGILDTSVGGQISFNNDGVSLGIHAWRIIGKGLVHHVRGWAPILSHLQARMIGASGWCGRRYDRFQPVEAPEIIQTLTNGTFFPIKKVSFLKHLVISKLAPAGSFSVPSFMVLCRSLEDEIIRHDFFGPPKNGRGFWHPGGQLGRLWVHFLMPSFKPHDRA